ncbi:MAG: TolC family protein, partial [Aquificaceae bacterium]|nr:TolC family protein [Aquificaceae bacterium]
MKYFFILCFVSFSFCQEVLSLNPQKVYELALKNNKEIQRLRHQIKALEIDHQIAKKYYLPVVYFRASLVYELDKKEPTTETSLNVVSTLYEFQRTKSRIELSKIRKDITDIMLQQLYKDIQHRIIKLFVDAHLYKKLTEVKREEMAIAYVRFDRARERKELGLTTLHEVLKLESVYREKRSELLQAQHLYNQALLEIKQLAGIPYETIVELEDLVFNKPEGLRVNFSKLKEEAMKENASLKIKQAEIRSYEKEIESARQILSPRVNLRISTDKSALEISTPIFDAGRPYRIEYLSSLKRSVQAEKENLEKNLELLFYSAPYEWEYLKGKYVEAVAKNKYAEENLMLRRSE